jgi:hypothetical protein
MAAECLVVGAAGELKHVAQDEHHGGNCCRIWEKQVPIWPTRQLRQAKYFTVIMYGLLVNIKSSTASDATLNICKYI